MPDIYVAPKTKKSSAPHRHKKPSVLDSVFSSMLAHPAGVKFETQERDEEVVFLMRQHFATNVPWIIMTLVLFILPLLVVPFLVAANIFTAHVPMFLPIILLLFWYVGLVGFFLINFLHWYFNIYILTNRRVIDIDFVGLLYKQFSATNLSNIEDITYKQTGFFSVFFNYGDVYIQTAGVEPNFEYTAVAKPDVLTTTIGEYMRKRKHTE